jgi:23S rRNA (guanosine2251-2'-O)-methyltransferase
LRKLKLEELGRLSIDDYKVQPKKSIVVVLDSIRSALNVGSIFRTCDAFAIEKIYLCGLTAVPPHKEITKSAIGATESVDWEYVESIQHCIATLKSEKLLVLGIEQTDNSIELQDFDIQSDQKYALVFGNEVEGIDDEILPLLDHAIEIVQYGTKHSLNVSVCAGVVLHWFSK